MTKDKLFDILLESLTDYVDLAINTLTKKMDEPDLDTLILTHYMTYGCSDILANFDSDDITSYLTDNYSCSDILNNIDMDDITSYVVRNDGAESIVAEMDKSDLREYLRNNYDPDDFIEMDWRY